MDKRDELILCGFNCVRSLCKNKKDDVLRLYFSEELAREFGDICKYMASKRRFYKMIEDKDELEKIAHSHHHQGAVAVIKMPHFEMVDDGIIDEWLSKALDVVFTDNVGNANNLGAIIRSMAFFGVENLVIPLNEVQSYITSATYRVAEGGMSFVNVYLCHSTRDFLNKAKGKMNIVATDLKAHGDIERMKNLVSPTDSTLLIFGNEVDGVSEAVRCKADYLIKVKGSGNIESLNVAQTATLFLQKLREIK